MTVGTLSDRDCGDPGDGLAGDEVNNGMQVPSLFPSADLPVRARAVAHDGLQVSDLSARAQGVDHVAEETVAGVPELAL